MQLTTEELDPIDDVTQEALREILESDVFGKFAILAESETWFIQAASDWQPTDECKQFLKQNDSDPWILEYHDGDTDTHFRANGYKTLNDVLDAFTRYLIRDDSWRSNIDWQVANV
ncbi:hypothetical protein [Rhodopirellula europaea]|uniref:Uncharacterized protein n=1 Tax=Rhodopirellula europaea 6C TaxID=1263867 RepID=M2B1Z1_9BACT|nr:hypothetical protein [Rhodopirellula europaea]EMB16244.1 hypothetical protein RE6C_03025 [Rhodopirellula europaea 6C]